MTDLKTIYRLPGFWVFIIPIVVYGNSVFNDFTFDDHRIIETNPLVHSLDIGQIFSSQYWPDEKEAGLYRPLTILSFSTHYAFHGDNPFFYHVVNILFHAVNVLLVYVLACRVLGAGGVAIGTALIFGLHPVQTEAVNGIVGRAELMSAFWVLCAWLLYIHSGVGRGERLNRFYGLSLVATFLGMLSKENAACAVGLLVVYDVICEHRGRWPGGWRGCLRVGIPRYMPYVLVVFGFLFLRSSVVGSVFLPTLPGEAENILPHLPDETRWLTTLAALGTYFKLLIFPWRLMPDYSYTEIPIVGSILDPWAWMPLMVVVVFGVLVFWWVVQRKFMVGVLGILAFVVSFSPVSNFVVTIGTILGERLLYLPMVGIALFGGASLGWLGSVVRDQRVVYVGLVLLLMLFGARTVVRNGDWQNDVTLFLAAIHDGNRSAKVYYNLGVGYRKQKRYDESIAAFEQVVEHKPDDPESWKYLGIVYGEKGQHTKAADMYEVAVKLDSTHVDLWRRLGREREALEDWKRAERAYDRALTLAGSDEGLHFVIAQMCYRQNRFACVIRHCLFVLEADTKHQGAAVLLARAYLGVGQKAEAKTLIDVIQTRWPDAPEVQTLIQKLELDE